MKQETEHDNTWNPLCYGNPASALVLLEERHRNDPGSPEVMRLGVAHLWLRKYHEAEQHFRFSIKTYPYSMADFFGMAGTAKWCANEHGAAVEDWHAGLTAQYADAGGLGVKIPLLLCIASTLDSPVFPRKQAEEVLRKKA